MRLACPAEQAGEAGSTLLKHGRNFGTQPMKSLTALRRAAARLPRERYAVDRPVDARGQYQLELAGEFPFVVKRLGFSAQDPEPPLTWHTYLELFIVLARECRLRRRENHAGRRGRTRDGSYEAARGARASRGEGGGDCDSLPAGDRARLRDGIGVATSVREWTGSFRMRNRKSAALPHERIVHKNQPIILALAGRPG